MNNGTWPAPREDTPDDFSGLERMEAALVEEYRTLTDHVAIRRRRLEIEQELDILARAKDAVLRRKS